MVDLSSTGKEKMKKEAEKETLETQNQELVEQIQRIQAEFINYRKRTDLEKQGLVDYGKEQAILDLLEIYENFQRAKECIDQEGIQLIFKQFTDLLNKYKVQAIDNKGKYDPEVHEVVCKENNEQEEDIIIEIFQKGYTYNGKVLRPSKVKVSGGKNE
ncbi:nucleotide exchange factor GrpE [archaeon]|jgi:molecular chaperone GrpE|nr:nucleotide exchange factor GrpE [archaeon]MBT4397345.1 nucleotide exchange factor GrpE [archaeon]MBT4440725.1 nucleotide exchange factor GrpE [archaeon]